MILRLFISYSLLLFTIYLIPAWGELEQHTITFCFTFQTGLRHMHRMDYSPCVNLAAMKNAGQVPCLQSHFPPCLYISHGWEAPLQLQRGCSCPGSVPGPLSKPSTRNGYSGGSNATACHARSVRWLLRALGQKDTQQGSRRTSNCFAFFRHSVSGTDFNTNSTLSNLRGSEDFQGKRMTGCRMHGAYGTGWRKNPSIKKRLFFKECLCASVNKSVLSAPY